MIILKHVHTFIALNVITHNRGKYYFSRFLYSVDIFFLSQKQNATNDVIEIVNVVESSRKLITNCA